MEEVVLLVDDLRLLSGFSRCRICHEEEFESSKTLEAPCACSGTVKVKYIISSAEAILGFFILFS